MAPAQLAPLVLLGLVVLVLVATFVRRRLIARGEALLLCAERSGPRARWHLRLARYDAVTLELYSPSGLALSPVRRVPRAVECLQGVETAVDDAPALIADAVVLRCTAPGGTVDLAVSAADYTTLRSWLESSPPGIVRSAA